MNSIIGFAINSNPNKGKVTIMNGINAQCIAQMVDAESPIKSSCCIILCLMVVKLIANHLQNKLYANELQVKNRESFANRVWNLN